MATDVLVVVQLDGGRRVAEPALELLDEAAALKKTLGGQVVAIVLAPEPVVDLAPIHQHGADLIKVVTNPVLATFDARLWARAAVDVCGQHATPLVLLSETPEGAALAPRLAARLGAHHSASTVRVSPELSGALTIDRAVAGGKLHASFLTRPGRAVVASFAPGSLGVGKAQRNNKAGVEQIAYELPEGLEPAEELEIISPDPQTVPLAEAQYVIAGGQGFRSKEDMELLWQLSRAIHMSVGGSKPTVDHEWMPRERLIGVSSGRRLAPEVFIGFGISGSSHFMEGMKGSQSVIAVNTNKGTSLMKSADLAIEADLHEVIPALIERLQATGEPA